MNCRWATESRSFPRYRLHHTLKVLTGQRSIHYVFMAAFADPQFNITGGSTSENDIVQFISYLITKRTEIDTWTLYVPVKDLKFPIDILDLSRNSYVLPSIWPIGWILSDLVHSRKRLPYTWLRRCIVVFTYKHWNRGERESPHE